MHVDASIGSHLYLDRMSRGRPVRGPHPAGLKACIRWPLGLLLLSSITVADTGFYESEPNDTPADFPTLSGEVSIYGTMVGNDQDGYRWTVTDNDARKRWHFELHGDPGALTITDIIRLDYAENGVDITGKTTLMKMGTRDGVTPSIHRNLLFEPGEYVIGLAQVGSGKSQTSNAAYRPPISGMSFGAPEENEDQTSGGETGGAAPPAAEAGAYRLLITEGEDLNPSPNPGVRASRDQAYKLRLRRSWSTFETEETAWYSLSFGDKDVASRWDVTVQAPLGRDLRARLVDANGKELLKGKVDSHGKLRFPDLAPTVTTWYLELETDKPGFLQVVSVEATGKRVVGEEAEPNNRYEDANRVDFSQPVTGRIGGDDAHDYFVLSADEAVANRLSTLRIESEPPVALQLCLHDPKWVNLKCRQDKTPIELPDLVLTEGDWGISIERAVAETRYVLSLTEQGPITPGIEAEPNDRIQSANGVPANLRIKGRFAGDDTDFFRFQVAGEPQLWRFQVIGDQLHEIGYYDGSLTQKMTLRAVGGQRRLRLDDIYLLPGTHYVRVEGRDGGKYALLARALGPPDPNGEIEPNDAANKQRLAVGQTRTGLLAERNDRDFYRFFLANRDHVRLTIQPPPDGIVEPNLYWYGQMLGQGQPGGPGEPLVIDGLFPPGDYELQLAARQESGAEYTVRLERMPRFSCPVDCEPNGMQQIYLAAPLPPDLVLEGRSGDWRDRDYYQLPAFDNPTELVIHTAEPVPEIAIGTQYDTRERLTYDAELGGYRVVVPGGEPYRLMLDSRKAPYRLELEFPNGPLKPVTSALPAQLKIDLESDEVAAYRIHGQRLEGKLLLSNTGSSPLQATLAGATSDYRWTVSLPRSEVTVTPGGSESIPFEITVPADAWADRPVRISTVARDGSGRQVETWREVSVGRDTPAVNPILFWDIPEALRGGFNAAWIPFGGEWTDDNPNYVKRRDDLRDGLVFAGARIESGGWSEGEKPRWTIDLPGDEPLPVAGMAIDDFGTPGAYVDIREATLLLSMDGENFEETLHIEALPVETEQHFVLEAPKLARFARLRIDSTFQERSQQRVFAAEWKVILEPGFDLSADQGFNLADPALGGHVVWDWPPEYYGPARVLSDRDNSQRAGMGREASKDYVIGFYQDRAARITRVEWLYPEALEERWKNFDRVEVSASLASSVGPWLPLGKMDLTGARAEATLELPKPAWARFVRLTAYKNPDAQVSEEPGLIRIREQAGGPDYVSVLTEWGDTGPRAYYELQAGLSPEPELTATGNTSRASAAQLDVGASVRGEVSLARRTEHWYRLTAPGTDNTLTVDLDGDPTVRTVLSLEDADGNAIPLRRVDQEHTPGRHQFEAVVEPGSEVYFHIAEPPRNVVFTWDTSASVNAYIPLINNSLVAFSSQVVPGQEAVNLMPFSMGTLLKEWYGEPYVLQTILNDYRRGSSSSAAEFTLRGATRELSPRAGTKAIMVITDGETNHDGAMWTEMRKVRPRIFAVQVAGSEMWNQNVMRDWAIVNGGNFTQLHYEGEMEVAFDRASTLLHRPAAYTLQVNSEFREAPGPGRLTVVAGKTGAAGLSGAVELILDASGSMLQRVEGKRRIVIAKEVLTEAVRKHIPAGTPVALRVFGHKEVDSCRTDLEIPLGPLDPDAAAASIGGINAMNLARTPIADSLAAVANDLKGASGGAVVLVTDGEETCDGDPVKVIEALEDHGFAINLNIVGFAIDDTELAAQFESWAELGGGRYFAANDEGGLSEAIEEALRVSFTVYDQGGNEVAQGQVGGEPVELEQGFYRVVVDTATPRTFGEVEVQGESEVALQLD